MKFKKSLLSLLMYIFTSHSMVPPYMKQENRWAEEIVSSLSLEEKIGQLFIVAAVSNLKPPHEILAASIQKSRYRMDKEYIYYLIQQYHIGGVIFLYKSDPASQMIVTENFKKLSKTPLFITQDCEWGLSMRLDVDPSKVVRYPHNMTLGALVDESIVYEVGSEIGKQCNALGVHMNYAPVADVNNNPGNPVIADRSFGDEPERVARLSCLFSQGLQDAGIIACAKHFPGHGDTTVDSHHALPLILHSKERLDTIELAPFKQLIDEGVGAVMNAHLSLPAFDDRPNRPSSLSYAVVTQELKERLGFQGLAITDGLGMKAITDTYEPGELELEAFLAGNDILLCPLDVPGAVERIKDAVNSGRVSQEDLDHRVLKILQAKQWALQNHIQLGQEEALEFFIRPEAYALQEKAFSKAITSVKHDPSLQFCTELALTSAVVAIGMNHENRFLKTLQKYSSYGSLFSAEFNESEIEACFESLKDVKTIIIGIGQITKYVQNQFGISPNTLLLIQKLKAQDKKLIIVIFGTPYCLPYFTDADALIAAYEDCEPAHKAAAHVVLGKIKAEGRLPVKI